MPFNYTHTEQVEDLRATIEEKSKLIPAMVRPMVVSVFDELLQVMGDMAESLDILKGDA